MFLVAGPRDLPGVEACSILLVVGRTKLSCGPRGVWRSECHRSPADNSCNLRPASTCPLWDRAVLEDFSKGAADGMPRAQQVLFPLRLEPGAGLKL